VRVDRSGSGRAHYLQHSNTYPGNDDLENIMYTIGKAATLAGVSTDTLRYYEKEGLITPASKTAVGYRLYNDDALRRICFIKHAQHCGFTLADILELLTLKHADGACCEDVRSLAIEKKLQIMQKLSALQTMSHALDKLIQGCDGGEEPADNCPTLGALENSLQYVSR
jgi:MerR family Zn(II)-responsive transcriptional regulator of zntA